MYERDYILRMIEAFAKMLAAIVGLRQRGELDKARMLVEEAYESILKTDHYGHSGRRGDADPAAPR